MRNSFNLALAVCAVSLSMGIASAAEPQNGAALSGDWVVDLTTDPKTPYTKVMKLTLNDDGSVAGSFYDSDIEAGRWKTDRGRICISFRTSDGVGPYHTAACLVGTSVQGQTWAEHRKFLFNWNATRKP